MMIGQEQCEWCDRLATYRVAAAAYKRFACAEHIAKVERLLRVDIGARVVVVRMSNAGGFALRNVRVRR